MREPPLREVAETHLKDNRLSVTWFVSFTVECFLQTELVNDSYLYLKIDDSTGLRWIQGSLLRAWACSLSGFAMNIKSATPVGKLRKGTRQLRTMWDVQYG